MGVRLTLPSGRKVLLERKHHQTKVRHNSQDIVCLATTVRVIDEQLETYTGFTYCRPNDQFCRRIGLYFAGRALMRNGEFRHNFEVSDRVHVLKEVCPTLFMSKDQKERNVYQRLHRKYGESTVKVAEPLKLSGPKMAGG